MREKRVSLVVLTCSVLVATCASVSYSFVTSSYFHKYVAVIPILFSGQINPVSPATVWIPEDDAADTGGSVQDEFAEVAHFFARPENRIVQPKSGPEEISQQPVPWTSLKNEWKIYQKIQNSKRKTPEEKRKKHSSSDEEENSSEEEEEEDEEDEEEDELEGRSSVSSVVGLKNLLPSVAVPERKSGNPAKGQKEGERKEIPLAFYGQSNHDDDERDYLKDEAAVFNKKRTQKKEIDVEDDDTSASNEEANEAASVEDYADYAQDDDDDEDNDDSSENQGKKKLQFEDIPLAIREMILNDLANQNNGSGYHPNLRPQVTSGSSNEVSQPYINKLQQQQTGDSSASVENDDESKEANSSEEDEERDNNAAEVVQPQQPQQPLIDPLVGIPNLGGLHPTPPAVRPKSDSKKKKGDDDEEADEGSDEGGKGKGKSKGGKKGKGKKGKGGGGWKGQLHVHHPGGWGGWKGDHHHHKDHGWGWDPEKHDGLLEQLVRGSTWERVLKYYHWKRDQQLKEDEHHFDEHAPHNVHTHSHPPHHEEHPGHELSHGIPEGWGWEPDSKIKKIVKKAFKGSFWERAVHTYAKYKENQAKNPRKPTLVDLDSEHGLKMDIEHR